MTTNHDRRTMLKATGALALGASFSGYLALGQPDSNDDDSEADVTVTVGRNGNLGFEPRDVTILPGTTVEWVWDSDTHNIYVDDQPEGGNWQGTPGKISKVYDDGYRYAHTFDVLGRYEYYCAPHKAAGATGSVTVAESKDDDAKPPENHATKADLPVEVGPDGNLEFAPGTDRPLAVPVGTEVTFVWKSDGNNLVVDEQPDGANWRGTPGGPSSLYDEGYEYSHTFDVPGFYKFHSAPYESAGMVGRIYITE
ncbi:plastocyanin/azurin family copper-binding protein [Haladaptatus sp. T7]|uniref:plastocyanin/azurin family copper-binding protein n=1 Tax=Haladaptatus sp. T7 TaxID=2029368 RepID=UPI002230C25E|nr:plastocyanin/azurin family copper-binding protein [Haladaptatus sp. T7]